MLEFNEQHKSADLSTIKPKLDRAKRIGKVMICGVMISATLLLSGCKKTNQQSVEITKPEKTENAIIIENGNALIIDVDYHTFDSGGAPRIYLITTSGEKLLVDMENVHIIKDENSREIAEKYAESLIAENGKITYYEDIIKYGRSK